MLRQGCRPAAIFRRLENTILILFDLSGRVSACVALLEIARALILDQGQPGLLLKLLLHMSLWGVAGLLRILPLFITRTMRVILACSRHYIFDLWFSVLIRRW